MHRLQCGLHNIRWYDYGSHGAEPMQRVCGWIWWYKFWRHERLHGMHSRHELQGVRRQQRLHGMRCERQLGLMHCDVSRHMCGRLY